MFRSCTSCQMQIWLVPAIHRGRYPLLEMVVVGVCAHGATNLFRCGQYPLLEGLLAGVSAHGELQELAVGRGCLRDACPRRDLASGIPVRWPRGLQKANRCAAHNLFCCPSSPLCKQVCNGPVRAQKKMMPVGHHPVCFRAENGVRTRGPQLGKLMLYQLSYFRNGVCKCKNFLEGFKGESHLFNTHCGGRVYFSYENCGEEHDEHYCCECNQVHREYCAPFKVDGYV